MHLQWQAAMDRSRRNLPHRMKYAGGEEYPFAPVGDYRAEIENNTSAKQTLAHHRPTTSDLPA
jgi:hypothetical protein